ncbi:uncharacterized protein LOC122561988 isoform X2 [Chiloscyllium plagiosum]|uniref:uncharacterized protein LOC122561988 isoform X2 n=1 Tax=Chiloscyllium plagiosum TaxID=36176 RepID=UPI001CB8775A|nr:uncharacterized protein LOC122561988 isoform X2 [Chiloscyllium plagiosum]
MGMPISAVAPYLRNQPVSFANQTYFPPVINNAQHGLPGNFWLGGKVETAVPSELEAKLAIFRHAAKKLQLRTDLLSPGHSLSKLI